MACTFGPDVAIVLPPAFDPDELEELPPHPIAQHRPSNAIASKSFFT
jgi:hypothetical protein